MTAPRHVRYGDVRKALMSCAAAREGLETELLWLGDTCPRAQLDHSLDRMQALARWLLARFPEDERGQHVFVELPGQHSHPIRPSWSPDGRAGFVERRASWPAEAPEQDLSLPPAAFVAPFAARLDMTRRAPLHLRTLAFELLHWSERLRAVLDRSGPVENAVVATYQVARAHQELRRFLLYGDAIEARRSQRVELRAARHGQTAATNPMHADVLAAYDRSCDEHGGKAPRGTPKSIAAELRVRHPTLNATNVRQIIHRHRG